MHGLAAEKAVHQTNSLKARVLGARVSRALWEAGSAGVLHGLQRQSVESRAERFGPYFAFPSWTLPLLPS